MALLPVTPGACQWVPISGVKGALLVGQAICPVHVPAGAARSEPHGASGTTCPGTSRGRGTEGCRRVPGCTRGDRGARVGTRCAHCPGWDECIYGVFHGPGRGRDGPRTVQEQCQGQCGNSANNGHNDTRHHPTPDTRHPVNPAPATHDIPRVLCYSVLAFTGTAPAISDLLVNSMGGVS